MYYSIDRLETATALILALAVFALPGQAAADVEVITGATPIPDGEANAAGDITVRNDVLALGFAVESAAPWGVPRGAIVDVAPVKDGEVGLDRVAFADFIPNNWSAWPNTYQRVEVVKETPEEVVIRAERDWNEVQIETVYTLKDGADRVHIATTMTNEGDQAHTDIWSGLTLWPDSGYLFSVPGLSGVEEGPAEGALADRVVAYDEGWTIALHAPYFDHINYDSQDMYQEHTLRPGESRSFEGWLQVGSSGDLAPIVDAEIERKGLQSGTLSGMVTTRSGERVDSPAVIVEQDGTPYAWTLGDNGSYDLKLPEGDYTLYATAKGYSKSSPTSVTISDGQAVTQNFDDLKAPGRLQFSVTDEGSGKPVDARISIAEGQKPLIEFLGKKTFFTQLEAIGQAELTIAPGDYVFTVGSGEGFLSEGKQVEVQVEPGRGQAMDVALKMPFDPNTAGWYAADMHHHADQLEGVTPPADVARAQLAAGLDILFLSDHDSTVNHETMQEIADRRGVAFVPSIELSPSWGHFNAYPLDLGEPLKIDPSTSTIDEILAEARRLGADAIQANHPFIPYGYFASLDEGVVPGGFSPQFDLLEINAANPDDDEKVLQRVWDLWNEGRRYYLTAGSDAHDVWNDLSGEARAYAHVGGEVTAERFVDALKDGHGYVTYGPLIYPARMFGEEFRTEPGDEVLLGFDLQSVNGLKQVSLISKGETVQTIELSADQKEAHVDFPVTVQADGWYAITVEDAAGKKAYSNPIWFDALTYEKTTQAE